MSFTEHETMSRGPRGEESKGSGHRSQWALGAQGRMWSRAPGLAPVGGQEAGDQ